MNVATTNQRFIACKILLEIFQNHTSFDPELITKRYPKISPRDRDFTAHLIFGVLRYYEKLEALASIFLKKALKAKDFDIQMVILVGIYQLHFMRTAKHAAINETVNCAPLFKKTWAKGLVNALLQKVNRQQDSLQQKTFALEIETAHPHWLYEQLKNDWPEHYLQILEANNIEAALTLRVNTKKQSREDYIKYLEAQKITAELTSYSSAGLTLSDAPKVPDLPLFTEGGFSVQDQAAQLAAPLLDLQPNQTILDACCAPGGKTTHILEVAPINVRVSAVEKNKSKMPKVEANLKRLGLSCQLINDDAGNLQNLEPQPKFDRILLDPPCSATGVIRRHPDIKRLRQADDIDNLRKQQSDLLKAVWPLLNPNGLLVYATCSVLLSENEEQIEQFLQLNLDAELIPIEAKWGHALKYGRQILPGEHNMDGFYYAKIRKSG
jgi:16S rRNA (cytosine967-C5)-methyltransferase